MSEKFPPPADLPSEQAATADFARGARLGAAIADAFAATIDYPPYQGFAKAIADAIRGAVAQVPERAP